MKYRGKCSLIRRVSLITKKSSRDEEVAAEKIVFVLICILGASKYAASFVVTYTLLLHFAGVFYADANHGFVGFKSWIYWI